MELELLEQFHYQLPTHQSINQLPERWRNGPRGLSCGTSPQLPAHLLPFWPLSRALSALQLWPEPPCCLQRVRKHGLLLGLRGGTITPKIHVKLTGMARSNSG